IRRVAAMGFTGTAFQPRQPPSEISTDRASEIGRICAGEGVDLVEYGQYNTTLVDPDDRVRATSIANLRDACRVARAAGCPEVIIGAGSLNPAGNWLPHPDNHALRTLDRLVGTLRSAAQVAEEHGLILGLECDVTTALKDARTARGVIDA